MVSVVLTDVYNLGHSLLDLQSHVQEPSDGLSCVHRCPRPRSQPLDHSHVHGPLAESRMQEKAFYVVTFEPLQI